MGLTYPGSLMLQTFIAAGVQLSKLSGFQALWKLTQGPGPWGSSLGSQHSSETTLEAWVLLSDSFKESQPSWGPVSKFQLSSQSRSCLRASLLQDCPASNSPSRPTWVIPAACHKTEPSTWHSPRVLAPGKDGLFQGPRSAHRTVLKSWPYWRPVLGSQSSLVGLLKS